MRNKQITREQVERLLRAHNIKNIDDTSTGSSFFQTFGLPDRYSLIAVMEWLGY